MDTQGQDARGAGLERDLAAATLVYVTVAAAFYPATYGALFRQYALTHFLALPGLLLLGLAVTAALAAPRAPISHLAGMLRARAAGAAATIALFCVGLAAFTTLKHQIPFWLPFFADRPLAALDAQLHFGQPWRWTHAVAPEGASRLLYLLYGPVWLLQWLGLMLVAAFLRDDALRRRYLISLVAVLGLLGTVGRVLGASAGPIFFDRMFGGATFADLGPELAASPGGAAMLGVSDYLFEAYESGAARFGSGISAMPSIHVAMAALNAQFLGALDRRLGLVGWAFAGAILFGSVYFGWHYALDGYVSLLAVALVWRWAGAVAARGRWRADRRPEIALAAE